MDPVLRVAAMYFFLMLVFRVAGKRTLAETTPFDLLMMLVISETTQQAMVDNDHSLTNAVLLILTLITADILISVWKQRSKVVQRAVDAPAVVIVQDGRILPEAANSERIDENEILEAARRHMGLERLSQVRYAVLEGSGKITVVPK